MGKGRAGTSLTACITANTFPSFLPPPPPSPHPSPTSTLFRATARASTYATSAEGPRDGGVGGGDRGIGSGGVLFFPTPTRSPPRKRSRAGATHGELGCRPDKEKNFSEHWSTGRPRVPTRWTFPRSAGSPRRPDRCRLTK